MTFPVADGSVSVLTVLVTANSLLIALAGFFLIRFVRMTDKMSARMQDMEVNFHSRLSVLEKVSGVYNHSSISLSPE